MSVLQNPEFARRYAELASVTLNPRRHLASDALAHSEAVAATARRLGERNQQTPEQLDLLEDLGRVHDIGKITGTARPERSLAVLAECGVTDSQLLALGGIEFDELPIEAAARELREEAGVVGEIELEPEPIGALEYDVGHRKRVTYFRAHLMEAALGELPKRTLERRWLSAAELDPLALVSEDLRPLLAAVLQG